MPLTEYLVPVRVAWRVAHCVASFSMAFVKVGRFLLQGQQLTGLHACTDPQH